MLNTQAMARTRKPKSDPTRRRGGPPTVWTPDVERRFLEALSAGKVIHEACEPDDMPGVSTVYERMEADAAFRTRVAQARARGASAIVAEAKRILDTADTRDSGTANACVAKAKSQAEFRRWLASCHDRATYGEKTSHEVTGPNGGPLVTIVDLVRQLGDAAGADSDRPS